MRLLRNAVLDPVDEVLAADVRHRPGVEHITSGGGGLAGLRAANAVDPSLSVLVVTKDSLRQSNSNYAQGGIAGVLDPEDQHLEGQEQHQPMPAAENEAAGAGDRGSRRDRHYCLRVSN